jgi:hypothetical protein
MKVAWPLSILYAVHTRIADTIVMLLALNIMHSHGDFHR